MIGVLGGALSVAGGIFGAATASKQRRNAETKKRILNNKLRSLELNRQDIINPYEDVQNLSGLISNPFANLGVATQAAEMKIEQADISLANTLDTLRSTGSSAGGATALAQAALQGKKGIAAGIEKQEAGNEKMRAQGEQTLQRQRLEEGKRIQGVQISEGKRVQQADSQGKRFMFNALEARETDKIDYTRKLRDGAKNRELGAAQAKATAIGTIANGLGSAVDGLAVGGYLGTGDLAKAGGYVEP